MIEPIIVKASGYEARTDGSSIEIRRPNGVIVGEGRIAIADGAFFVGDYSGTLDEDVRTAVKELLVEHEADIVAAWIAAARTELPS